MHSAGAQFQEDAELVIDLEKPEPEAVAVLAGKPMSESGSRRNLEVIENNDGAGGCLVHREKEGVLALGGIRRAVDENELRLLQTQEGFALGGNIERLDRPETVPAAGQGHDIGEIRIALRSGPFQLFGPTQPIRGIFDAGGAGGSAPQGMGGTAGTKLESHGPGRQKGRYFFQEAATPRRKNPGRDFIGCASGAIVFVNKTLQLVFKGGICRSEVGFSDNLSELLSPFRSASAVSARFSPEQPPQTRPARTNA
jgi:hypothetical protein